MPQDTLSQHQQSQYWEDGYLFPLDVMPAAEAAGWRAELETIERDWLTADLPLPLNRWPTKTTPCWCAAWTASATSSMLHRPRPLLRQRPCAFTKKSEPPKPPPS